MTNGTIKINFLERVTLSEKAVLTKEHLAALPPDLQKAIFKGYSEVFTRALATAKPLTGKIGFETKLEKGQILVNFKGQNEWISAGDLRRDFPELSSAMRKAHDVAIRRFPETFTREGLAPKGSFQDPVYPENAPSSCLETAASCSDATSLTKNVMIATADTASQFFPLLTPLSSTLNYYLGTKLEESGEDAHTRAVSIGDQEGAIQAYDKKVIGQSLKVAAAGQSIAGFASLPQTLTAFHIPSFSMPSTLSAFFGAFSYLAMGGVLVLVAAKLHALYHEWPSVARFRDAFKEITERNVSEKKRTVEALEFLKDQLRLTSEDWKELRDNGADEKAISNKKLEKYDSFVRKVGAPIAEEVLLLNEIDDQEKALDLIEQVNKAIFKNRVKQITQLAICILTVAAFIAGFVFLPLEPILFAVGALLWLTVDCSCLHNAVGSAFYAIDKALEALSYWCAVKLGAKVKVTEPDIVMVLKEQLHSHKINSEFSRVDLFLKMKNKLSENDKKLSTFAMTRQEDKLGYRLLYNNTVLYTCQCLNESERQQVHALKVQEALNESFKAFGGELTVDNFLCGRLETATDDPSYRNKIEKLLLSSDYSSDNCLEIVPCGSADPTFEVKFKNGESLMFSNRISANNEFRSEILRDAIRNTKFENLQGLFSKGYLTEKDNLLLYLTTPVKGDPDVFPNQDPDVLRESLIGMRSELAKMNIGNTTLEKLLVRGS